MTMSLRQMLTCRWSARRIQRYLDADPAAPMSPGEVARLEAHLATCERCTGLREEHQALSRALARWPGVQLPDEDAVRRIRDLVGELTGEAG